ncbi:hypothetical protein H0H87_009842 [Tephrocybe sp. NHM501043]|nr:hypothetical protein H0H87_009842 [Tephrocybe sp. NHM501043]
MSSLVTDVWSRFKQGQMDADLFSVLLRDAASLIRPLTVTMAPAASPPEGEFDATSHPHSKLVLGLSDLTTLFGNSKEGAKKTHVTHKLFFYVVHVLSTPTAILLTLAEDLVGLSASCRLRAQDDSTAISSGGRDLGLERRKQPKGRVPIIEEL